MLVYSFLLYSLVTFAAASQSPKSWRDASILNEARYLGSNGQFVSSIQQNDGLEYKEEADEYGNRKGSYSYIDSTGERRTVTFTAGKDGFKASGAHLPSAAGISGAAAPASAPTPITAAPSYSSNLGSSYSSNLGPSYSSNLGSSYSSNLGPSYSSNLGSSYSSNLGPSYSSNLGSSYSSNLGRSSTGPALDSGFYNSDFDYPDGDQKSNDDGQYVPESQSYNSPSTQPALLHKSAQPSYNSPVQFPTASAGFSQYTGGSSNNQYSTQAPVQQYPTAFNQYSSEVPAYQSYNQVNTETPSYRSQSYPGKFSVNRSPDGFGFTFNAS